MLKIIIVLNEIEILIVKFFGSSFLEISEKLMYCIKYRFVIKKRMMILVYFDWGDIFLVFEMFILFINIW